MRLPGTCLSQRSSDSQLLLHLFERNIFGFRIDKQDHKELKPHHEGEKEKGIAAGGSSQKWKNSGNERVHKPVRKTSQTLAFGPDAIGKNLTDKNPDDRSLRKSEETNIANQQPNEKIVMAASKK